MIIHPIALVAILAFNLFAGAVITQGIYSRMIWRNERIYEKSRATYIEQIKHLESRNEKLTAEVRNYESCVFVDRGMGKSKTVRVEILGQEATLVPEFSIGRSKGKRKDKRVI